MRMMRASAVRWPMPGTLCTRVEAAGEIAVLAQVGHDPQDLAGTASLEARNVGKGQTPQPRLIDMFEPHFEARDILFGLLEEGQMPGERGQASVRLDPSGSSIHAAQAAISLASSTSFLARCERPLNSPQLWAANFPQF